MIKVTIVKTFESLKRINDPCALNSSNKFIVN